MFPTSSNIDLAGRNALSATDLTISPPAPELPHQGFSRKSIEWMGPPPPITVASAPGAAGRSRPGGSRGRRWYVARALGERGKSARPSRGVRARIALGLALSATVVLSACGGSPERQDADEPEGEYPVDVTTAKFPTRQRLAEKSDLELAVRNIGKEQIPDLAITICVDACEADGPFSLRSEQPGLANPNRPVWILEQDYPKLSTPATDAKELDEAPSAGAEAAQTNTFSFGPLPPGDEVSAVWRVTPVQADTYTLHYEVAASLTGVSEAVTGDGSTPEGEFLVTISDKPPRVKVTPEGKIVEE